MRHALRSSAAVIVGASLWACSSSPARDVVQPAGAQSPIALVLSRNVVQAGDVITIQVRSEFAVMEGVGMALHGWRHGRLEPIFTLIKGSRTRAGSYWSTDENDSHAVPLVGLRGGVPRRITVPEGLTPGNYRIVDDVSFAEFPGGVERPRVLLEARITVEA